MSSFNITRCFCRSVLPSRFVTREVLFFQPPKFALRNSRPDMFQSLFSRTFTNPASNESEKSKSASLAWKKKLIPVSTYLGSINWKGRRGLLLGIGVLVLAGDLIYLVVVTQSNQQRVNKTL